MALQDARINTVSFCYILNQYFRFVNPNKNRRLDDLTRVFNTQPLPSMARCDYVELRSQVLLLCSQEL